MHCHLYRCSDAEDSNVFIGVHCDLHAHPYTPFDGCCCWNSDFTYSVIHPLADRRGLDGFSTICIGFMCVATLWLLSWLVQQSFNCFFAFRVFLQLCSILAAPDCACCLCQRAKKRFASPFSRTIFMEVACLHGASIRWALCSLFTVAHLRYLHVNSLRVAVCLVVYVYACMHVCIVETCMFINVVTCGGCSGPSGEPMIWPASSCFIDSERTSQAYQRVCWMQ